MDKKNRKRINDNIIKRMKNGDSLTSFDSQSSWFPSRPLISKDLKALNKLYSVKKETYGEKESNNEGQKEDV